jgi:hypothetical protein
VAVEVGHVNLSVEEKQEFIFLRNLAGYTPKKRT